MKQGRDNYNRLYELLALITAMRKSMVGLTYDDIHDKFGWERKTIERMLKLLETQYWKSFIKERGDDNKKYFRLSSDDDFPPNYVSESEVIALRTALGFVGKNEALKLPLESLAGKLEAIKNSRTSNIEDLTLVNGTASAPRPHIKLDRKIMEPLQEAILACRVVEIEYTKSSGASTFPVCPLGFLYGVQNNYLVAADDTKKGLTRRYILNQVTAVKLTNKSFDAKGFDIHKYAEQSFGVWISGDGHKVKWRIVPDAVEKAKRFTFHPTQKMTLQKDGSLIVEFTAEGLKEMVWHLMTWEGKIQPLAPKELIEEYKNQLKLAADALK
jgi:predicted DNA-binding transcriptional regulator YafY